MPVRVSIPNASPIAISNVCALRLDGLPGLTVPEEAAEAARSGAAPLLALPLACADRDETWRRLAAAGIYCAVHWRDGDWSGAGGRPRAWAESLLSVPVDQRYDPEQLARIPEALA